MPKEEALKIMGKPVSASATKECEYLNYRLAETSDDDFYGRTTPYYIRIIDGKVESYGRVGDFDSTKTPTVKVQTEESIKQDAKINIKDEGGMYTELKKLKELRDEGIITKREFDREKKEILEKY